MRQVKILDHPKLLGGVILIALFVIGSMFAQQQYSGGQTSNITQIGGAAVSTAASGIIKVGLADASGNAVNSTANALNVSIANASIASTQSGTWNVGQTGTWSVGINAGTNLIGTTMPKTGCGTTVYDSLPANLPSSLTVLTSTATCVEALYLVSIDSAASHPVTFTDGSATCNAGTCNLLPPAFVLNALEHVRVPMGNVKAVGGLKWNTDAANKVTAWVEGAQ